MSALVGLFLLILGYCGLFAFSASFQHFPLEGGRSDAPANPVRGAYHVHSELSDGRGSLDEIARAAKKAGLSFVLLADHNQTGVAEPRWMDGVLLLFGTELSTSAGHLVVLGQSAPLDPRDPPAKLIRDARSQGALSFIAHPVQKKRPWTDWGAAAQADGLELYSADSLYRQALRSPLTRLLPAAGAYLTQPVQGQLILLSPQPEVEDRLLELSQRAPKIALCAHDAHGIPPYEDVFAAFSMTLPDGVSLPKDPLEAQRLLLQHLAKADAYCAFQGMGGTEGFRLDGISEDRSARVGDTLRVVLPHAHPEGVHLRVRGPGRVLSDGLSVQTTGVGPLWLEVQLRAPGRFFGQAWRPWIVPSPILVKEEVRRP